ncbi:diacylglycerol/lipid kinase family protein [[Clostridium] hylemonae]|uniref:Lipid kinase, YegS/Rv2252/BmrU family n=1 Tax=[Clostridium] hylemonae DSM 15053 TaxID=553973 RepID=C0C6J2_9FIRM|nr:diacylglycerol kinase family protein [[Clostridium] hylemonae]EEG72327.1 lipid kinase, YegS/Rv2252/BmrU family [[Clostridium] hylemonae DSM 15053]QEK16876.1 Putative lipid kinase YtlR [[Clostridium] hylemonae DSM 15053]BDF03508.1 putative lipid kinase YtlR [[Clostridium] hylemonae]
MYTFIVNPNARSGLGHRVWAEIERSLKERGTDYQVYFTKYQRHASAIAGELTSDLKAHTLIVLGGDGTVNEVMNGIADLSLVTFGYIPIGSSNDFARGLGLSTDALTALSHILTPSKYTYINVGTMSYQEKKRRFAVSTGIGFDAGVCHQVVVSRLKVLLNKIGLGKLSYAGVALSLMMSLKPRKMTVTLDDSRKMEFESVYFAAAMNQRYEGGGFKFCPAADPSDDILDVIVIANMPKLKALALLPTAFSGRHVRFRGIHIFTCRKVDFVSETALPVHTDGEPIFLQRHMSASLEPQKVRIILS